MARHRLRYHVVGYRDPKAGIHTQNQPKQEARHLPLPQPNKLPTQIVSLRLIRAINAICHLRLSYDLPTPFGLK